MGVYIHDVAFRIPGANKVDDLSELFARKESVFQSWNNSVAGFLRKDALETDSFDPTQKEFQRIDQVAKLATILTLELAHFAPELIHLGSARGATATWEKEFRAFSEGKRMGLHASPLTTLGNMAFHAARLAGLQSNVLDQSMTCSSGLHSVIEAARRIQTGEIHKALAGGVEAPLTDFTHAQFENLKLLSHETAPFPCRPLASKRSNQLVLAEGGALFALSNEKSEVEILGYGESWTNSTHSLAFASGALIDSMTKALKMAHLSSVDAVLVHAPGTKQGDLEEATAVRKVLGPEVRMVPTKWLTGHTLGASGPVAMMLGMQLLFGEKLVVPYDIEGQVEEDGRMETILVNATGFGGNAASVVLRRSVY